MKQYFIPKTKSASKVVIYSMPARIIMAGICLLIINCSKKETPKPADQKNKPVANFNFKIAANGALPCTVNFSNLSKYADGYKWDFGDSHTSTSQNADNTYTEAKTYNVKLVVSNSYGKDSITKSVTVTLNKPKAGFSFKIPNNGILPCPVNFTDSSQYASTYKWTFGDGATSTDKNPANTYKQAKTYNVKLVVSNAAGADSITKKVTVILNKPKADFTFQAVDQGNLPTTVNFTNTTTGGATYLWTFDDGNKSTLKDPVEKFSKQKTYNVKLVATNAAGKDSVTKQVAITIGKPTASFTYTVSNTGTFPVKVTFKSTVQRGETYAWDFNDGSKSASANPVHNYIAGGKYKVNLTVSNSAGSISVSETVAIPPYPQLYKAFDGKTYNLYAWEGKYVTILMRKPNLNANVMNNWVNVMDQCYLFYRQATGREPYRYTDVTYINNRTIIADVATTCGAGCGYIGATGIEMQNIYTDRMYDYALQGKYDQELFYEFGRNYYFYTAQLTYKDNDPVTTGFAIFMRFMAMDATQVSPAPFVNTPWTTFRTDVGDLVNIYESNTSYTWANTLAVGKAPTNPLGLGASDLVASFLMRLKDNYGDDTFVNNFWKQAELRPAAATTQDAVDNFILAACAAANKNLTKQFTVTWRWPMSASAKTEALKYP